MLRCYIFKFVDFWFHKWRTHQNCIFSLLVIDEPPKIESLYSFDELTWLYLTSKILGPITPSNYFPNLCNHFKFRKNKYVFVGVVFIWHNTLLLNVPTQIKSTNCNSCSWQWTSYYFGNQMLWYISKALPDWEGGGRICFFSQRCTHYLPWNRRRAVKTKCYTV